MPLRRWIFISLVTGLCAWLLVDNLAIGSNFGRFVLSREWQNAPLTIIRLCTLYDYVEHSDYIESLHVPLSALVERNGGRIESLEAVRFADLCSEDADWQEALVYEVDQGRDFSKLATSVEYRNLRSANASVLRASAEIAIQSKWDLDNQRSYLMLLIERHLSDQANALVSVFAKTMEKHQGLQIALAESAFALTGKRKFAPDFVLVIAFAEIDDLVMWLGSISTQSELAILDAELGQVQAFLLRPES